MSAEITAKELAAMKSRCVAKHLVPGPWTIEQNGDGEWDVMGPALELISTHNTNGEEPGYKRGQVASAVFIANARTDLPRLIAALEASQARIAAYECLQQSTQTRVRELEDDNSALKLSLSSGGGRLSSGAKIWLQQKERAERAEARVAVLREVLAWYADPQHHDRDFGCGEWKIRCQLFTCDEGLNAQQALSTLDPAAERLLAERKLLREVVAKAQKCAGWAGALHGPDAAIEDEDRLRDALTALREFDEKETK